MKKILAILGLFVLSLLYFSDALSGRFLLVERDLTTFFYPFRYIWVETVRQGQFPFWNPYIKCGVPLFATLQPGVLYPLSLPYLFLPLDLAFNWTIIFHFFLAAAFTYLLMRELGATVLGGMAGALAFLFSGYLISVHNVLNTLLSVSWYPLAVFCGCRLVRKGSRSWAIATGVSLCCMFLGGGIEIVIFTLVSLLLLCCYPQLLPQGISESSPRLSHRLALFALVLLVFLGLSMIQFLPSLELYRHSSRYGGVSLEQAMRWSLPPRDFIYFLIPDLYGPRSAHDQYWVLQNYLKTIYVGPIVFFLSGFYFFRQGRRGLFLLAAMGIVLIFAMGDNTPLYPIFYKNFPLFSILRYPVKFLFLLVFSLCVTAGLGLDELSRRFSEKRAIPGWGQGVFVAAVLVLAGLLVMGGFYPDRVVGLAQWLWGDFVDPTFLPKVLHNFVRLLVLA